MMGSQSLEFQFGLGRHLGKMCFFLDFCRIFWSSYLRGIYRYLYRELSDHNQDLWEFQTQCSEIEEAVEAARMDRWVHNFASQPSESRAPSLAQRNSAVNKTACQPLEDQRMSHSLAPSEPSGKLVQKKVDDFLFSKILKLKNVLFRGSKLRVSNYLF